jgi:hypothetical protein
MKKVKTNSMNIPLTNLVRLIPSDWSKSLEKIKLISEAWQLAEICKASNATLEDEERAAILHDYIISKWYNIEPMKNGGELFTGNWVMWYNVSYDWKKVGIFKTFSRDANVIFQAYWDKHFIKEGKLTSQWVMQIKRVEV